MMTQPIPPVKKSVRVNAPQARAFDVFTRDFDRWWPRAHHIGASPMKQAVLEPKNGGRWYERGEDGSECEWGRVQIWEPPQRVLLIWQIAGDWKYDSRFETEVEVRFIAEGPAPTLVDLEHRHLDHFGGKADQVRRMFDSPGGWNSALALYAALVAAPSA